MAKKVLIWIAMMPLLNLAHESGHWIGAKAIGANPTMLLQRVEIENDSQYSTIQLSIYNWAGPAINYAVMAASFVHPAVAPAGFLMACHRLGPNLSAFLFYLRGNLNFATDETKQFPEEHRLVVALLFSAIYLCVVFLLVRFWFRNLEWTTGIFGIIVSCALWLAYLISLDYLDRL